MSIASEWAEAARLADESMAETESNMPPSCTVGGVTLSVTRSGGLHIDREAVWTVDEALEVQTWFQATFQ